MNLHPKLELFTASNLPAYAGETLYYRHGQKLNYTVLPGPASHAVYGEVSNRTFCHTKNRAGNSIMLVAPVD